ncbi:MAG: hypothetical protein KA250_07180 [Verrucomicrobiales bacterium]|nr:hypothetical protein [Verrucomicrobiales bacterium]
MNESPPALPSDFKLRKGYLVTSGILFVLAGLNLCGFGALMVVQYFLMDQLGGLDPKGAAQLAPMKDMMGMAAVANLMIYGGTGVLMIVLAVGFFTKKRWSRPIALTVSWAWLYIGVTMIVSLLLMMGAMKSFMVDAMKTATPAGTTAPPMENFFGIFLVIYFGFLFFFLVLLPALLLWLNWGRDVRKTLELYDPKPRWTDRQATPVIGLTIAAVAFAVFSISGILMMNQPWMNQFLPGVPFRYFFYLIPFVWIYIAWGSYRGQIAAWVTALVVIVGSAAFGIHMMQNIDWAVMYREMGMPEAEVARMALMITEMMSPKKMGILMCTSMLPQIAYLLWVLRFFRKQSA